MQHDIAIITGLLSMLLALLFIYITAHSSKASTGYQTKSFERLRSGLFWASVIVSVPVITVLTMKLPYAVPSDWDSSPRTIDAVGHQWYWELSDDTVNVGERIRFRVSSSDVTHSFALYDPSDQLVAQTQAMPGYTNNLYHEFTKPGTYKVMCLEYCGVAHQGMVAQLEVAQSLEED